MVLRMPVFVYPSPLFGVCATDNGACIINKPYFVCFDNVDISLPLYELDIVIPVIDNPLPAKEITLHIFHSSAIILYGFQFPIVHLYPTLKYGQPYGLLRTYVK
jgi:hypothetical protein